jgi:hypothetical protein
MNTSSVETGTLAPLAPPAVSDHVDVLDVRYGAVVVMQ